MNKIEIKKIFVNGIVAAGMCIGATACSNAQAQVENTNSKEEATTSISETVITTVPESKIEVVTENTISTTVKEEETTVEPAITTAAELETTTSVTTIVAEKKELTKEDIVSMSKEYGKYLSSKNQTMINQTAGVSYEKTYQEKDLYAYVYLMNEEYVSETEKTKLINDGIIDSNVDELVNSAGNLGSYIGFCNGSYAHFMNIMGQPKNEKAMMSASEATINNNLKTKCISLDKNLLSYLKKCDETQCVNDYVDNKLYRYSIPNDCTSADYLIKLTYDYSYVMYSAQFLGDNVNSIQNELNEDFSNMKICLENSNAKQKVLTNN